MAKEKKELTTIQKQKRYRVIEKTTFYSEFLAICMPYLVMCGINFDEWFRTTEGWKVGLGGGLAIIFMCITILSIKNTEKENKSRVRSYIQLLLKWLAFAFIFFLLADIIDQIATIMFFGALGIAGALGLDITSTNYGEMANMYNVSRKKIKQEKIEEEVRQETMLEQQENQRRPTE